MSASPERQFSEEEIRRYADRFRVLADSTDLFADAVPDYPRLLQTIARRIASVMGDCCVLWLPTAEQGAINAAAYCDGDPEMQASVRDQLAAVALGGAHPVPDGEKLALAEPRLVEHVELPDLYALIEPPYQPIFLRLKPRSLIIVPLRARGHAVGLLYVVHRSSPPLDENDLSLSRDLADRAAMAIDNSWLYRQAQERTARLQESEDRFSTTLRSIGDGVIATDPEGRVTFMSAVAESLTGWTDADARGRQLEEVFNIVNERTRRQVESPAARAIRESGVVEMERGTTLVGRQGAEFSIADTAAPIRGPAGQVLGVVVVFRDVTRRRREEELQRLVAEASTLLLSSLDYEQTLAGVAKLAVPKVADLCLIDLLQPDGALHRMTVALADPAKAAVAREYQRRYPPNPNANAPAQRAVRTGEAEVITEVTEEMIQQGTEDELHAALLRAIGPRSSMTVPLKARSRILGAITFVSAESGRRYDAESLVIARDLAWRAALALDNATLFREAQDAVRARDEFVSIASHELRTPLTSLQLSLEAVATLLERSGLLNERVLRRIEVAVRQARRLNSLVGRLLDVSRISTGELVLELEDFDLVTAAADVVDRYQEEARQAGVTVDISAGAAVPGRWDRLRVEQILSNLLSNAIKYGAGQPVEVRVETEGGEARLIVIDHGIGISPEDQHRIFGRFERAASVQGYGGLGLGLYVAQQNATAHGGSISVESELGKGSAFTVHLPLQLPASNGRRQLIGHEDDQAPRSCTH